MFTIDVDAKCHEKSQLMTYECMIHFVLISWVIFVISITPFPKAIKTKLEIHVFFFF